MEQTTVSYPNLMTSSLKELLEFYNTHCGEGEQVKKFKDKDTAQTMVSGLIAKMEGNASPEVEEEMAEVKEVNDISIASQVSALNAGGTKSSTKNEGVWANVKILFEQGLSNKDAHKKICELYGNTNTTYACVAWYRNKFNKGGAGDAVKTTKVQDFIKKHGLTLSEEAVAELMAMVK